MYAGERERDVQYAALYLSPSMINARQSDE